MSPICQVRNLSLKRDQQSLLTDLTFEIAPKGLTLILGANGSGKTLLQRVLQGLISPSQGQVDWHSCTALQRRALLQKPVFLNRSLIQNLRFVGSRLGLQESALMDALLQVGLSDKANQQAQSLSGGEQQRLAFARETLGNPKILLMDEPTANLDPQSTRQIEALLTQRILQTNNQSLHTPKIVLATHDRAQIARLTQQIDSQVLFLDKGRLTFQGPYKDFVNSDLEAVVAYHKQ